jgi:hypothetical protein
VVITPGQPSHSFQGDVTEPHLGSDLAVTNISPSLHSTNPK